MKSRIWRDFERVINHNRHDVFGITSVLICIFCHILFSALCVSMAPANVCLEAAVMQLPPTAVVQLMTDFSLINARFLTGSR